MTSLGLVTAAHSYGPGNPSSVTAVPSGFTACGTDGKVCKAPAGVTTVYVLYGAGTKFATAQGSGDFTCLPKGWVKTPSASTPIDLGVDDPVPGVAKTCYIQTPGASSTTGTQTPKPITTTTTVAPKTTTTTQAAATAVTSASATQVGNVVSVKLAAVDNKVNADYIKYTTIKNGVIRMQNPYYRATAPITQVSILYVLNLTDGTTKQVNFPYPIPNTVDYYFHDGKVADKVGIAPESAYKRGFEWTRLFQ